MSTGTSVVVAAEEHVRELPIPPVAFGLIAFGILLALLLITLSFNKNR